MSIEWCFGGVWPNPGTDATDIATAIYDARCPAGSVERRRRICGEPPSHRPGALQDEREADIFFQSAVVPLCLGIRWYIDGDSPGGDDYFAGTSPRTPQESRRTTHARQRQTGEEPVWTWEFDYFPFHLSALVNGPSNKDGWSIQEEYFWLARNVLIPRGWASYMYMWHGTPDDTWGTVPGHPDPVKLPDGFRHTESDAWSLFDREPAT